MAPTPSSEDITALLAGAGDGDEEAVNRLWELVYDDLRRIAHHELYRRRPGQTIHTTALVNEAYIRFVGQSNSEWHDRLHFFAFAAKAMRHILIDYARQQSRQKRGGGKGHLELDEAVLAAEQRADTFLALDEALGRLATLNERLAQVVEYRFFGGMTEEEIAQLYGVSDRTVRRDWRKAKAWLADALTESNGPSPA
jgi:RNA polymerase sigma factor (TIGR02999 family)